MRKRTLVTAVIMFAAIGTGTAGAFSFGSFFSLPALHLFGGHTSSGPSTPAGGRTTTLTAAATPSASASCAMYTCQTTTTISCTPAVVILFGFPLLPADCKVTVTNLTNNETPTGTVTVTADGAPTQTCTLHGSGASATCTISFGSFAPSQLQIGPLSIGLFSEVTANYSGAAGLAPSSGSTRILVSVAVF